MPGRHEFGKDLGSVLLEKDWCLIFHSWRFYQVVPLATDFCRVVPTRHYVFCVSCVFAIEIKSSEFM